MLIVLLECQPFPTRGQRAASVDNSSRVGTSPVEEIGPKGTFAGGPFSAGLGSEATISRAPLGRRPFRKSTKTNATPSRPSMTRKDWAYGVISEPPREPRRPTHGGTGGGGRQAQRAGGGGR